MRYSLALSALLFVLTLPAAAQDPEPDAEGCKDSKLVPRMKGCFIVECSIKDFDSADVLVGMAGQEEKLKSLEGAKEEITYRCPANLSGLQLVRNVENAMRQARFTMDFTGKDQFLNPAATGHKDAQWIGVRYAASNNDYTLTALLVKKMEQELTVNADTLAAEIEKTGRVAVYGIQFDTGKSAIKAESESVLAELLALLNGHEDWRLRVEGHTDNVGAKPANQALSQQRAAAVMSWLVAKGVDKSRLAAQGFGDTKPVADNSNEDGRAKNRRVELSKM